MKYFLMFLTLAVTANIGFSNELDQDLANQQRFSKDLPRVLVMRVDDKTGAVAVFHSAQALSQDAVLDDSKFVEVSTAPTSVNELDKDSSASGWYFYWNNYNYYNYSYYSYYNNYYPTYYYSGYNYYYRPYYNNYYNNCHYYWYSW